MLAVVFVACFVVGAFVVAVHQRNVPGGRRRSALESLPRALRRTGAGWDGNDGCHWQRVVKIPTRDKKRWKLNTHTDRRFFPQGREVRNHERVSAIARALVHASRRLWLHNYTTWLDGGTLLAYHRRLPTVMPWDYDADLGMWFTDYHRLLQTECVAVPRVHQHNYDDDDTRERQTTAPKPPPPLTNASTTLPSRASSTSSKEWPGGGPRFSGNDTSDGQPVTYHCPRLSSERYLVEADIGPYKVPLRFTDRTTGVFCDVFVIYPDQRCVPGQEDVLADWDDVGSFGDELSLGDAFENDHVTGRVEGDGDANSRDNAADADTTNSIVTAASLATLASTCYWPEGSQQRFNSWYPISELFRHMREHNNDEGAASRPSAPATTGPTVAEQPRLFLDAPNASTNPCPCLESNMPFQIRLQTSDLFPLRRVGVRSGGGGGGGSSGGGGGGGGGGGSSSSWGSVSGRHFARIDVAVMLTAKHTAGSGGSRHYNGSDADKSSTSSDINKNDSNAAITAAAAAAAVDDNDGWPGFYVPHRVEAYLHAVVSRDLSLDGLDTDAQRCFESMRTL
jgi:hypothetical protein